MATYTGKRKDDLAARKTLLFHFCRMQLPAIALTPQVLDKHLQRVFDLFQAKSDKPVSWQAFLDNLYALDWYVVTGCLAGSQPAWEALFAARANRADCLLVDALRARATRLYPGDEERQESAVSEFWSQLIVPDAHASLPILARYDGQRPLVPWLIRVFQNWHISQLRQRSHQHSLPEDDVNLPLPDEKPDGKWHESFCVIARDWLAQLSEQELLLLGLRMRYRQSQREVAQVLGVHEGTISRQTTHLRDRCLEYIGKRLLAEGWTGDELSEYVLTEMGSLIMDEPRLSADRLALLLAKRGLKTPEARSHAPSV